MIQLTLTLKMTTAQVVETSVTVNNNSPIQDYVHLDDQTQPTFEMTPGFKPFTKLSKFCLTVLCKNMGGINFFIRVQGSKFWGKWGSGIKITARK